MFFTDLALGTYPSLVEGPLGVVWVWSPGTVWCYLAVLWFYVQFISGEHEGGLAG